VLELIRTRTFRKAEFPGDPVGQVRVAAPLSHELVSAVAPVVRDLLAPLAERMARMLAAVTPEKVTLTVPTVLTWC
jgi:hypothetical protein